MKSTAKTLMKHPLAIRNCHELLLVVAALGITAVVPLRGQADDRTAAPRAQVQNARDADISGSVSLPTVEQKDAPAWGRFVSFRSGTLTLRGNTGYMVWRNLPQNISVCQWNEPGHQYLPLGRTSALTNISQGTWIFVAENRSLIQVGAGKESHVTGTFLSFEGERLLIGGSDLGNYASEDRTKLHFPKFVEGIPVYTRIGGKELKPIGPAEKVLPHLKSGQRITVYGEGDFNFTKIIVEPEELKK